MTDLNEIRTLPSLCLTANFVLYPYLFLLHPVVLSFSSSQGEVFPAAGCNPSDALFFFPVSPDTAVTVLLKQLHSWRAMMILAFFIFYAPFLPFKNIFPSVICRIPFFLFLLFSSELGNASRRDHLISFVLIEAFQAPVAPEVRSPTRGPLARTADTWMSTPPAASAAEDTVPPHPSLSSRIC